MEKFLFCMRLSTAGVVIGWVGAVLSILTAIIFVIGLSDVDELVKILENKDAYIDVEYARHVVIAVLVLYLVITLINLLTSVLLVVGAVKERHLLLLPWLLNSGVSLIVSVIFYVYAIIGLIADSSPFNKFGSGMITWGLSVCFQYYIWYTIMSLFKKIRSGKDQQQILLPASYAAPTYCKL